MRRLLAGMMAIGMAIGMGSNAMASTSKMVDDTQYVCAEKPWKMYDNQGYTGLKLMPKECIELMWIDTVEDNYGMSKAYVRGAKTGKVFYLMIDYSERVYFEDVRYFNIHNPIEPKADNR
jgi:hypothetical protein